MEGRVGGKAKGSLCGKSLQNQMAKGSVTLLPPLTPLCQSPHFLCQINVIEDVEESLT